MRHQPVLNEAGIGLLEILLATVLIVFGVVAVVKVMSAGLVADNSVDRQAVALGLAQAKMEDIKNEPYSSIVNEADAQITTPTGYTDFNREVDVTGNVANHDLLTVTTYIYWDEQGQAQQTSLTTLIADVAH